MKTTRRRAELTQQQVAEGLGLTSHVAVARWEKGHRPPPAEKLVRIAEILGVDVDFVFPREGPCDLIDLRCDAGFTQGAAADAVAGLTRHVLGDAEGGERRLAAPGVIEALAALYGVTPDEVKNAQERSFGVAVPVAARPSPPALTDTERRVLSELRHFADQRGIALSAQGGGLSAAMIAALDELLVDRP